jgi:Protein of unknown function (DUF1176)
MKLLRKWLTRTGLVAAVLAAVTASPVSARAQSLNTFDDWMLGCDNRRECVAIGLEPQGNANGIYLRVLRSGEGHAEPTVKITAYEPGRWPWRLRLAFDDPALPVPAELAATRIEGRESIEARVPAETVRSFLDALRRAKTLSVSIVSGTHATQPLVISLSGASAALASMDEQQKRIGTTSALAAPGSEPATRVPPPPALPVVRAGKRTKANPPATMPKAIAAAVAQADCDEPPATRPIRAWLDERTLLWGVLCTKGAYRETYAFFVHRRGAHTADPLNFQMPGLPRSEDGDNNVTGPSFDRKSMTLSFHDLGRSMGDCGTAGRFVWDGSKFQPVELRGMTDCRGVAFEDWPVTWRARTK